MHAVHTMRPIATSVCLSVGHTDVPRKNGWTDRNAVWTADSGGPKDHVLNGGPDSQGERAILGVVLSFEKHCDSRQQCMQQKNQ